VDELLEKKSGIDVKLFFEVQTMALAKARGDRQTASPKLSTKKYRRP